MALENSHKLRVGIPWRTSEEERNRVREKLENYFAAVRRAGGEPMEISLSLSAEKLAEQMAGMGGFCFAGGSGGGGAGRGGGGRDGKTETLGSGGGRGGRAGFG